MLLVYILDERIKITKEGC